MPEECIFCKIAKQEIPVELLYDDELLVAFRDNKPVAPVHILIIPKKHIPGILHLADEDADVVGKIIALATTLARKEGIADSGFRIVVNSGPDAGQSVPHLHFHLLGGRELSWPPG